MAYDDTTTQLPWTAEDQTFWTKEIKDARAMRTDVAAQYGWDDNLKRYVPKFKKGGDGKAVVDDVNIGADFRDVERKKAALLFEFPQIGLSVKQDRELVPAGPEQPKPLMLSTLVAWHADILNEILGPNHAHAEHAARKALFNCLCPAGVGPVRVGYQVTMKTVTTQTPVIDPVTGNPVMKPVPALEQAGAMLGLIAPPMPEPLMTSVEVDVPIDERWFVADYSPKALLIPASFRDTNFKKAPWLGHEFRKPTSQIRREFNLPKDWTGRKDDADKPFFENDRIGTHDDDAGDPYVTGVEVYYRTQMRADSDVHPDALRKLVLIDGQDDAPLVHADCPYQTFGETGELTPDSLTRFVDIPLVLRDLSDSAWIPSDCAVTAALTKELDKYRGQIIAQRDGNKQVIAYDSGKVDPTAKDKIVNANGVIWVPLAEGAMGQGIDAIMKQVAQPTLGRETYIGQDYIEKDREQILGISANQTGVQTKGKKTATEQTIVQRNSEARFEQERQRVMAWILDVASAIDTLVLRYGDARIATKILGDVRGQLWAQHKAHLFGGYTYDLKIDSGKYMDIEADRRQVLQFYNIVRKDPFVNPRPILNEIALKFGYDPGEFVAEPQQPPKELKAAFSFKGEDLNPANPAFALVVKIMRQAGWDINEQDVQIAQQQAQGMQGGMMPVSGVGPHPGAHPAMVIEHPGPQPKTETINQHQADESGARSGPRVA